MRRLILIAALVLTLSGCTSEGPSVEIDMGHEYEHSHGHDDDWLYWAGPVGLLVVVLLLVAIIAIVVAIANAASRP